jgi:hypothetical protein
MNQEELPDCFRSHSDAELENVLGDRRVRRPTERKSPVSACHGRTQRLCDLDRWTGCGRADEVAKLAPGYLPQGGQLRPAGVIVAS